MKDVIITSRITKETYSLLNQVSHNLNMSTSSIVNLLLNNHLKEYQDIKLRKE